MKKEITELTKHTERYKMNPSDDSLILPIGYTLKSYSLQDEWVFTIIDKNDGSIKFHEVNGKMFIPVFSDEEYIRSKGHNIMAISINKLISLLLANPNLGGIEINPFTIGLCIETGTLIRFIFGEYEKYQKEQKDWGEGIPKYSQEDLLDEKSILDFAIQIVSYDCNKNDLNILYASNDVEACPNMIIKDKEKLAFILAEGDIYPNKPELSFEKRKKLFERAKQFGFDCYYGSVGFMSSDKERGEKSIALRGDAYYVAYEGLKPVENTYD